MIRHVVDRLIPHVDEFVINCRSDQRTAIGDAVADAPQDIQFAIDPTPDQGPMAGIATGLSAIQRAPAAMIVACDMPFVEPSIVDVLFDSLGSADAVVPRIDGQWLETTHAVYRRKTMLAACRAALDANEDRIVHALDRLDVRILDEPAIEAHGSLESFENINTVDELEAAENRLADNGDDDTATRERSDT